ncbi:hypothetical protein F5877DRAFT_77909 [Lentinula edodes]|nr:hypothetical protein F5877DRAFT_77909 [Lentinula edodes]
MSKRRVSYFYDPDVGSYTYGLGHPMEPHRILMAHELISSYPSHLLLSHSSLTHFRPPRASAQQMTAFHTDEYVHFLSRVTPETMDELTGRGTQFLVGDDNPAFEGIWEFCTISAGGSLGAARLRVFHDLSLHLFTCSASFVYHLQSQTSSYHSNRHRHLSPSSSQSSPSTSDNERDVSDDDREYDSDNSYYSSAIRSTRSTRSQARNALNTNDSKGGDSSRHSHQPQPQVSSTSSASAARKRMSILTNMVFDISLCSGDTTTTMTAEQYVGSKDGKMGRRRFFFDTGIGSELGAMNGLQANGIHGTDTLPSSRGASPFITGGGSVSARSVREATEDLGDMGDEDTVMMMDSRAGTPRGTSRGMSREISREVTRNGLKGVNGLEDERGILHRDLTADHILIETNGTCKISDFGNSKHMMPLICDAVTSEGSEAVTLPNHITQSSTVENV